MSPVQRIGIAASLAVVCMHTHAQALAVERSLSLNAAMEMAKASLDRCRADGYKVTITVLNRHARPAVVLSDDGVNPHTVENSLRKAYTAFTTRAPSADMAKRPQPGLAGFLLLDKITTQDSDDRGWPARLRRQGAGGSDRHLGRARRREGRRLLASRRRPNCQGPGKLRRTSVLIGRFVEQRPSNAKAVANPVERPQPRRGAARGSTPREHRNDGSGHFSAGFINELPNQIAFVVFVASKISLAGQADQVTPSVSIWMARMATGSGRAPWHEQELGRLAVVESGGPVARAV